MGLIGSIGRALGRTGNDRGAHPPRASKGDPDGPLITAVTDGPESDRLRESLLDALTQHKNRALPTGDVALISRLERAVRGGDEHLPAMPEEVRRIRSIVQDPDCSTAELAHAIVTDPVLAGKFVAVANAPFYSRGIRVRSVRDAVCRVGMHQALMIIMAVVSGTRLFRAGRFQPEASLLHAHSLGAAVVSQLLARRSALDEQDAFMAGLLHDMGEIVILQTAHELEDEQPTDQAPRRRFVLDLREPLHAGLSALTLQLWDFPPEMISAVLHHHAVDGLEDRNVTMTLGAAGPLVHLLSAADQIARWITGEREVNEEGLRVTLSRIGLELDPMMLDDARVTYETFLGLAGTAGT